MEGYDIEREYKADFSPYRANHDGRLGSFELNLPKKVKAMDFDLEIEQFKFLFNIVSTQNTRLNLVSYRPDLNFAFSEQCVHKRAAD